MKFCYCTLFYEKKKPSKHFLGKISLITFGIKRKIAGVFLGNEEDCEVIIPHIQSPATCGTSESSPRIQNKCLSTWGFSSTTFSGEPISGSTSWTVTIERNTAAGGSHLTSCNTGYLFGIGVSSEVCTEVSRRNGLFTLPDPDSDSDCRPNR